MSAKSNHLSTFGAETETEAEIRWTLILMMLHRSAAEDERAAVCRVLLDYSCQNIIESLRDDFDQPGDVKSLDDYAACCRSVQLRLLHKFRHFIFLSGE